MELSVRLIAALKAVCRALNSGEVAYALAGGLAVGMLARPRATEDIDLLVLAEEEDRGRILEVLQGEITVIKVHDEVMRFAQASIWRIIIAVNGTEPLVLDLIFADNEVYRQALKRKLVIDLAGVELPVVTPEDLILMKMISNRDIDKIDVKMMLEELDGQLDKDYLADSQRTHCLTP